MTSAEPLRSALSIGNVDDTALALPSADRYQRSGQQRVLEQVQTVRRSRSRPSSNRSGSTSLSPTNLTLTQDKSTNSQALYKSKVSTMKSNKAGFLNEQSYAPAGVHSRGLASTSRSESDLLWKQQVTKRSVPPLRQQSNRGTYRNERSTSQYVTNTLTQLKPVNMVKGTAKTTSSQFIHQVDSSKTPPKPPAADGAPKTKGDSGVHPFVRVPGVNGNGTVTDITMKEAVEYLSSDDEKYKHCGASYIQHNTYINEKAKEEVLKFNGIPLLVGLLQSPSSHVSQTASAALRNLSFKNNNGKEEIQRCGGIGEAVALLRDTDSVEMQRQLTGLLWNLSSADSLKPDLLKSALPVLMERVILPYTTGPDRTDSQDHEVFYHATGCLRNLSSAKQSNRQAMRKCRGLIDSLVTYVRDCVETGKPDDKSVENCVCILHNLTFQLEAEAPALFSRITALAKPISRSHSQSDSGPIGCFSPQSKGPEQKQHFDFAVVEEPQPSGAGWLIHSKTLQSYLSLIESSQRDEVQEACCGVLQNLTANEGIVSSIMSQTIVQKLNGLEVISPLLKSNKVNLQRNMVALVRNLTKNPNLHSAMARRALPELLAILSSGTKEGNESDDTLAMACHSTNCLLMKEPEMGKHLLNNKLINSLNDLSQNRYFPKSSKSAALLLYNLWSDKDMQNLLKKQGMSKSTFVNDTTTAAHRSLQVID
ncbi:plakophilin-1-like [Lampetra planeri]